MKKYFYDDSNNKLNPINLNFLDSELEKDFTNKFNRDSAVILRFGLFLTFLLFTLYGLVDVYVHPLTYKEIWLVRALQDILLVTLFFFSFNDFYIRNLQIFSLLLMVEIGTVLLYLYTFEFETNYVYIFISSYALLIVGSFSIIGLKFFSALIGVLILNLLMAIVAYIQFGFIVNVLYAILFVSLTSIVIVGAYFSEKLRRKLFLKEIYTDNLLDSLEEAQKELKEQVNHDYLTGLYNRRYLSSVSEELIKLAKRNKKYISIIIIDIDYFKNINDNFGHNVGDQVLKYLSGLFNESTRESDIVARIGGEEFAILLPDTDKDSAYIMAEKIRKVVQSKPFVYDENITINITISAGVNDVNPDVDKSIDMTIDRADKALYKAKHSGRNMVVSG